MTGAAGWDPPGRLATAATRCGNRIGRSPGAIWEEAMSWRGGAALWCRSYRLDLAWVAFVGINLAAMRLLPDWGTVPFLALWVSLTAIYGVRLSRRGPHLLHRGSG